MTRKEMSDAIDAIEERRNNYKNSMASVNLTDEQEEKIQKAIEKRLKENK